MGHDLSVSVSIRFSTTQRLLISAATMGSRAFINIILNCSNQDCMHACACVFGSDPRRESLSSRSNVHAVKNERASRGLFWRWSGMEVFKEERVRELAVFNKSSGGYPVYHRHRRWRARHAPVLQMHGSPTRMILDATRPTDAGWYPCQLLHPSNPSTPFQSRVSCVSISTSSAPCIPSLQQLYNQNQENHIDLRSICSSRLVFLYQIPHRVINSRRAAPEARCWYR